MRVSRSVWVAGLISIFAAPMMVAQGGMVSSFSSGLQGMTGAPYTATEKTTRVQTLADGTTITHESTLKLARDSNGKTYREVRQATPIDAENEELVNVFIFDPANRININWNSRTKIATIVHMPDQAQIRPVQPPDTSRAETPAVTARNVAERPQLEDLGSKTICGVTAHGTRITRIIPVGKEGNDRPITVVDETWRSQELRLVLQSMQNDPRIGVNTVEVTDIEQGEPDPALFQVPAGYTVKEQFPQQQNQN
jgi:antitoxin (DNA-binding transcriptional repressor) of toxin-antitoxin stability system